MARSFIAMLLAAIRQYCLDNIEEVRGWIRMIELGLMDEGLAEMCFFRCQTYVEERRHRPNYLEVSPRFEELYPNGPPDLILGHLVDRPEVPIGLFLRGAVHGVFAGTTEAGKTVAIRRLLRAVYEYNEKHPGHEVVVLVLDRKPDYLDPKQLLGERCLHFNAHGSLRLSMKAPAGVPVNLWINLVSQTFCARAGLIAARASMAKLIRDLVGLLNQPGSGQPLFPDFRLMLDTLWRMHKRAFAEKDSYTDSLTQYLMDVTYGTSGLFESFYALDLESLIRDRRSVVISMPLMSPDWISRYIADVFVLELLLGRSFRGHRVDRPDVLLIIDEADEDVSRDNEKPFAGSFYPLCRGMRLLREFGVGIFVAVGALNPVSQHVLNAARYKFVLNLSEARCMEVAVETLLLPQRATAMVQHLLPGQCLFRSPHWPHTLLAQFDFVPPCRDVQPVYDDNPFVPSKRLDEMPEFLEALGRRVQKQHGSEGTRLGLREDARKLLFRASLHPAWPVARLYGLGKTPSAEVQKAVRAELGAQGYAAFQEIRVGSHSRLLIEVKEKASQYLGDVPKPLPGRGGIAHRHIAAWIQMVGKARGYDESVVEWVVPGTTHPVDAAWRVNGRWQVFEVVVECENNLPAHLKSILLHATETISRATIVAPQKNLLKELRKGIEVAPILKHDLDRVAYEGAEVFLKELFS